MHGANGYIRHPVMHSRTPHNTVTDRFKLDGGASPSAYYLTATRAFLRCRQQWQGCANTNAHRSFHAFNLYLQGSQLVF